MILSEIRAKFKYKNNPETYAKSYAREVAEAFGLKAGFDIFKLAQDLGIQVYWIDKLVGDDGTVAWGQKFKDEKSGENRIILSREIPYQNSIRFTLAHEIAHFLIDGEEGQDIAWKIKFLYDEEERPYNVFAINLLIPNEKEYQEIRKQLPSPSDRANYFRVPITSIEIYDKENGYGG